MIFDHKGFQGQSQLLIFIIILSFNVGIGSTGRIYSGILMKGGIKYQVAVKRPKANEYCKVLFHDALMLSQFNHKNIIKLIAVSDSQPEIALELMDLGNLNNALEVSIPI